MLVCVFTRRMDRFWRKTKGTSYYQQKCQRLYKILLSGAIECEIDKQGRFLVTSNLREFAGLEKDVIIIGVNTRIEIWSKERWSTYSSDENINVDEIAENMTMLGI